MDVQQDLLLTLLRPPTVEEDALEVLNGPEDGRLFPLRGQTMTIGRLDAAEIALQLDETISRNHARLTHTGERYAIEDLGSTHGTSVNGKPVHAEEVVKGGDIILVGSTLLRLRLKGT
jgi:pSer/pThr/pTyr-binding forkhead associated (FHA) protein